MKELRVDGERLWQSLMDMARIGTTPRGGSCRLALTDEDQAGRDLFVSWCVNAGCSVSVDDLGNIFCRRSGHNGTLPPVAAGSHLDTQPHGGKFDGVYGVLAGREVIRTLNDLEIETEAPIEAVVWTNEEGARFAPAMAASGVYAGLFDHDDTLGLMDANGRTWGAELERIGYAGTERCGRHKLGTLFEAHIEQGSILERNNNTIGVVLGAQGQRWYDLTGGGQDSHAGSTPMPGRRDALMAVARMTVATQELARSHAPDGVATIGSMTVYPNSRNTVPGRVECSVDLRHPRDETLALMDRELREVCERCVAAEGVELALEEIWHNPPVEFDDSCVAAVRGAANELGYRHQDIVSGAGHDACQVCRVVPTAMIFVPCAGGLSHNEEESAEPQDLEAGCNVLLRSMLAKAGEL